MTEIRALQPADGDAFIALRRRGLEEDPFAFCAAPDDDVTADPGATAAALGRGPDSIVIGAFAAPGGDLVGVIGLYRRERRKESHKGFIWGMYVAPEQRRHGIALRLLEAAMAHGRRLGLAQLQLSVSEPAAAARRLYEQAGFVRWGTEPGALCHAGEMVDDHHLALRLDGTGRD